MRSIRACKRVATLLAATAFLAAPSHPQAPKLCDQPLDASIADMFERVRRLPGAIVEPSANGHFDVIRLEAQGQLWNFTKASHPAHPAMACRRIVGIEGQLRIKTGMICYAAKSHCERLAADYDALDKRIQMEVLKKQAPKQ